MTTTYDVIVIGAGPAGAHCARQLAKIGHQVLLVERSRSHGENAFSSAASPISVLRQFDLPESTVACRWRSLSLKSTHESARWDGAEPLGVVFDFGELRKFLCADAERYGASVLMAHEYLVHANVGQGLSIVKVRDRSTKRDLEITTRFIVDATGPARAAMNQAGADPGPILRASGIEVLIDSTVPLSASDELKFFVGKKWAPGGYAWIFPMQGKRLKVGVCEYHFRGERHPKASLKQRLSVILASQFPGHSHSEIETHGGVLRISLGLRNRFFKSNVVAIGDAISAVNPLGGEGIRHGMFSAHVAAQVLHHRLATGPWVPLTLYRWRMKWYFGLRWAMSEFLMSLVYGRLSDSGFDRGVKFISRLRTREVMQVLFDYRFGPMAKRAILKIRSLTKMVTAHSNWFESTDPRP